MERRRKELRDRGTGRCENDGWDCSWTRVIGRYEEDRKHKNTVNRIEFELGTYNWIWDYKDRKKTGDAEIPLT